MEEQSKSMKDLEMQREAEKSEYDQRHKKFEDGMLSCCVFLKVRMRLREFQEKAHWHL